jgi:hypothetical protein
VHGLPRQHNDVWLWLFPNRLIIILVYVRYVYSYLFGSFFYLSFFPSVFIKVRPRSVSCVLIYTHSSQVIIYTYNVLYVNEIGVR